MAGPQRSWKVVSPGVYLIGKALYLGLWIYLFSLTPVVDMILDSPSIVRSLWAFVVDLVADAVSIVSGNGSPHGQRLGTGALGSVLLVGSAAFFVVMVVVQAFAAIWEAWRERRRAAACAGREPGPRPR